MSKFVAVSTFAGLAPPWSLTNLDANDTGLAAATASANADSTYNVDTGSANAYAVALPANITATLTAGLIIWWKASATNTGSSSLAVGALGAQSILNPSGSNLSAGQIPAGAVVGTMYDGTNYYLVAGGVPLAGFSAAQITNSLSGDVNLSNVGQYFDGPQVAQGTTGVWFASGTVTCTLAGTNDNVNAKLWDGTTVIASTRSLGAFTNNQISISLSGFISSPAGNIRISVNDPASASSKIVSNASGNSKDSTITAYRIA